MDDKELFDLRQKWYSPNSEALYEMVKTMFGREVIFLEGKSKLPLFEKRGSPVRMIKAHALTYLQKNFDAFDFMNKPYNIYQSIALFENMPMASFNPVKRRIDQDNFFQGIAFDLCFKGYDFFMDLDAKKIEGAGKIEEVNSADMVDRIKEFYAVDEMYADAKKLKSILDEFGLAYSVKFSGLKGMHFTIKDENIFGKELKPKEKVILAEKIAKQIKETEDIPTLDTSIYQSTRIIKSPYSLEGYFVALPLSDEQFDSWQISKMRIDSVLKEIPIRNRGMLERLKKKDPKEFISLYGSEE